MAAVHVARVGKLRWHKFENNRYAEALENNASILGTNLKILGHIMLSNITGHPNMHITTCYVY